MQLIGAEKKALVGTDIVFRVIHDRFSASADHKMNDGEISLQRAVRIAGHGFMIAKPHQAILEIHKGISVLLMDLMLVMNIARDGPLILIHFPSRLLSAL